MLLTKLEKLLFLVLPVGGGFELLFPSSEYRLVVLGARSSDRWGKRSTLFCSAVKLVDCLKPRDDSLEEDWYTGW